MPYIRQNYTLFIKRYFLNSAFFPFAPGRIANCEEWRMLPRPIKYCIIDNALHSLRSLKICQYINIVTYFLFNLTLDSAVSTRPFYKVVLWVVGWIYNAALVVVSQSHNEQWAWLTLCQFLLDWLGHDPSLQSLSMISREWWMFISYLWLIVSSHILLSPSFESILESAIFPGAVVTWPQQTNVWPGLTDADQ